MAFERSAKTREQNRLSMWIAALVVGVLIVVILVACAGLFRRLQFVRPNISHLRQIFLRRSEQNGRQTGLAHILVPQLLSESAVLGIIKEYLTKTGQFDTEN